MEIKITGTPQEVAALVKMILERQPSQVRVKISEDTYMDETGVHTIKA